MRGDYNNDRDLDDFREGPQFDESWEFAFDMFPQEYMSDSAIDHALDMIQSELDNGVDWDDIIEEFDNDFWEWFRENY